MLQKSGYIQNEYFVIFKLLKIFYIKSDVSNIAITLI
jgi:hypothetical protein